MSFYDFSDNGVLNIDTIMDAIVDSRKMSGIEGSPEEAVYDEFTGRRYRRFQKRSKKEEDAYQELKKSMVSTNNRASQKGYNKEELARAAVGLGCYERITSQFDDADEYNNAPTYTCEYCSKLSRNKKYNPVICDNCSECLNCNQFSKECSGCEYSRWREGTTYGRLIGMEQVMSEEDMEILDDINESMDNDTGEPKPFKSINILGWSVEDC